MALDTYANLKTALSTWSGRVDLSTIGADDDGIDLFEAWCNRNLRVRSMLMTNAALTLASGAITHPTDWLQWKSLTNPTSPYRIEIVAEESLSAIQESQLTGNIVYAVPGATSTALNPAQTSIAGVIGKYYGAIPALSGLNATNWLLTKFPDAYLYGCLLAMGSWARDTEQRASWGAAFDVVIQQIKDESDSATYGGSTLQIRNAR
jgi:hypothetical protein